MKKKSKKIAYVLAVLLPSIGGHQIYLGHHKRATAYIVCTILSLSGFFLARYYLKRGSPEAAASRLHAISVLGVATAIVVNVMFVLDLLAISKEVDAANARLSEQAEKRANP